MSCDHNHRLKRLRVRARLRGTREANLIFKGLMDSELATLDDSLIQRLEELLDEDDHMIVRWVIGTTECPVRYADLVLRLRSWATVK